jgi:predicted RNA-binding protein
MSRGLIEWIRRVFMCQTVAYVMEEGKEVEVLQDVVSVVPMGDAVKMVNLFGEERVVPGRIRRIDLLAHRILIQPET